MVLAVGASMLRDKKEEGSRRCQGEGEHPSPRTSAGRAGAEPLVPAYAVLRRVVHGSGTACGGCRETLRVRGVPGEGADRNVPLHGAIIVPRQR